MSSRRLVLVAAILLGLSIAPVSGGAQDMRKLPRVAVLNWYAPADADRSVEPFRQALRELGYIEGRNIVVEFHFADERSDRAASIAAELVRRRVDVIVTQVTPAAHAAKNATRTIPIVMGAAGDPVATGLAQSLARPGGNITGVSLNLPELAAKRLELLREVIPSLSRVAYLGSTKNPSTVALLQETQAGADRIGVRVKPHLVDGPEAFEPAFAAMAREQVAAVIVQPIFTIQRTTIVELAARNHLPIVSDLREFAEAGALLSYGPNRSEAIRRAASYVDKVLKGARPGDLPIEEPTTYELVVNLKTAKTLGLTVPPAVLLRADEVIE